MLGLQIPARMDACTNGRIHMSPGDQRPAWIVTLPSYEKERVRMHATFCPRKLIHLFLLQEVRCQ